MKNYLRRIVSVAAAICLLLSMTAAQAFALPEGVSGQAGDINILYTNDVHTYINNDVRDEAGAVTEQGWDYAAVAALKKSLGPDTLLVDAGDHIQGTAYGSSDEGKTIIELMNMAGYDAATLGNHEFDYGMERTLSVIAESNFPYLSCNFYHEQNGVRGSNVLASYEIFAAGGKTVAIIGITTPESFTKSTPAYFQDKNGNYIYGISGGADGEALYDDVQQAINEAQTAGADYVIALGHLGVDLSSAPWRSTDVIANTEGLDAFIDGHSHTVMEAEKIKDEAGEEVLLTQTGSYFDSVGQLTISADGEISARLLDDASAAGTDADVQEKEQGFIAQIEAELGTPVGYAEVVLDNYDADGNRLVRKQETNSGDFAADALYYLFDTVRGMDVDVAVMNGGGIRNGALTGTLTYMSCKEIHTFGNVACLQEVSGQQLLDALEWGAKDCGLAESGGFLHTAGLTYEIDTTIKSTVQMDDKGVWTGGPTGEYRVKNVKIYNKESGRYEPLELDARYNLAGYNYTLRDLGDGFAMFDGAVNIVDYVMEDYMVLATYIESFPTGESGLPTITAENSPYGDVYGSGRIRVLTAADQETPDQETPDQETGEADTGSGSEDAGSEDENAAVPETGDAAAPELWALLALLSALALYASAGCYLAYRYPQHRRG